MSLIQIWTYLFLVTSLRMLVYLTSKLAKISIKAIVACLKGAINAWAPILLVLKLSTLSSKLLMVLWSHLSGKNWHRSHKITLYWRVKLWWSTWLLKSLNSWKSVKITFRLNLRCNSTLELVMTGIGSSLIKNGLLIIFKPCKTLEKRILLTLGPKWLAQRNVFILLVHRLNDVLVTLNLVKATISEISMRARAKICMRTRAVQIAAKD